MVCEGWISTLRSRFFRNEGRHGTLFKMQAGKQQEDARTANQVALRQPRRVVQQAIQPLESRVLNPFRSAALAPGQKIDRCADAKRQTARASARLQRFRQDLLLRTTNGQQAKSKR